MAKGRRFLHTAVLAKAIVWVLRNPVFTPKKIGLALGLGEYERELLMRELLRLGAVQRVARGQYVLNGDFVHTIIYWSTGRRVESLVHEYILQLRGAGEEEVVLY